jgi:hypothetical protein
MTIVMDARHAISFTHQIPDTVADIYQENNSHTSGVYSFVGYAIYSYIPHYTKSNHANGEND